MTHRTARVMPTVTTPERGEARSTKGCPIELDSSCASACAGVDARHATRTCTSPRSGPGPSLPTPNDSAAAARPPIPRCEHDRTLDPWLARRESPPTVRDRSCSAPAALFHVERDRLTRRRRARRPPALPAGGRGRGRRLLDRNAEVAAE